MQESPPTIIQIQIENPSINKNIVVPKSEKPYISSYLLVVNGEKRQEVFDQYGATIVDENDMLEYSILKKGNGFVISKYGETTSNISELIVKTEKELEALKTGLQRYETIEKLSTGQGENKSKIIYKFNALNHFLNYLQSESKNPNTKIQSSINNLRKGITNIPQAPEIGEGKVLNRGIQI